ncbi:MAG: hypothetical protein ACFB4J_18110 [Elainellaceae cyanobacterium]
MKTTLKLLFVCLAAASTFLFGGQALAQVSIDPSEPAVVFYEGRDFNGRSGRIVVEMGPGSSFQRGTQKRYDLGDFANKVSSLEVTDGFAVRLYDTETDQSSKQLTGRTRLTGSDNKADKLFLLKK